MSDDELRDLVRSCTGHMSGTVEFDQCLHVMQNAIGVGAGDLASVYFSFGKAEWWDQQPRFSVLRYRTVLEYLTCEVSYMEVRTPKVVRLSSFLGAELDRLAITVK